MNKDTWEKISRIKNFDSVKAGFLGYCQVCKENMSKGKEIVVEKDGLRKWVRTHAGACTNKLTKLLKKGLK